MRDKDSMGWLGATVDGKYRVDEVVGEGGFAVVYRAHHLALAETVALKCLKMPARMSARKQQQFHEAFIDEGRLLHRLSKANTGIVQALDVGSTASPRGVWTPYLVLEWLDGCSLKDHLRARRSRGEAPHTLEEAIELLTPVAGALEEAHQQRIAHRDIKPANLFLTEVGRRQILKVLDFGIAKVLKESESMTQAFRATGVSIQAFTPEYGAPEQFDRGFRATGPWTDVFALALVFVELLIGRRALEGRDPMSLLASAIDPRRPTPNARGARIPPAVDAVVQRALAVDGKQRHATAGAFWAELRETAGCPQPSSVAPVAVDEGRAIASGLLSGRDRASAGAPAPTMPGVSPTEPGHPRTQSGSVGNDPTQLASTVVAGAGRVRPTLIDPGPPSRQGPAHLSAHALGPSLRGASPPVRPRRRWGWLVVLTMLGGLAATGAWVVQRQGGWRELPWLPSRPAHDDQPGAEEEDDVGAIPLPAPPSARPALPSEPARCRSACDARGACTFRDGRCVALSRDDCRRGRSCSEEGLCSPRDDACVAGTDFDCLRSLACTRTLRCAARAGRCVHLFR